MDGVLHEQDTVKPFDQTMKRPDALTNESEIKGMPVAPEDSRKPRRHKGLRHFFTAACGPF